MIPVSILDVGASGGPPERWLHPDFTASFVLIDALNDTTFFPNESVKSNFDHLNVALWSCQETRPFFICAKPYASSLLRPNIPLLKNYPNSQRYNIVDEVTLNTTTIDDLFAGRAFDLIKIDAQGATREIVIGGADCVKDALAVEVEVEFIPIYERQSLFSSVNNTMNDLGFEIWNIMRVYWRKIGVGVGLGRLAWANVLYVQKELAHFENSRAESLFGVYLGYELFDHAARLLVDMDDNLYDKLALSSILRRQMGQLDGIHWRQGDPNC